MYAKCNVLESLSIARAVPDILEALCKSNYTKRLALILFPARARRRFQRGMKRKPLALIKKLKKAKLEAPAGEKPELVKTHLRNMIIVPGVIGVYNGKVFNTIKIKPEMIGNYLTEYSLSYKPVKHGRPTLLGSSIPLK